jgi:hypothetical protein
MYSDRMNTHIPDQRLVKHVAPHTPLNRKHWRDDDLKRATVLIDQAAHRTLPRWQSR